MRKTPARLLWPLLLIVAAALSGCSSGPRIKLDPESRLFFETARLVMTKEESRIFTHLPDKPARDEFIQEFWEKRDPDLDTEENEFQQEFYRRVEYANQRFKEGFPGWKTDRGRIYIYFGPADKIDRSPFLDRANIKGMLIWYYYRYGFAIQFIDKIGSGAYTFDPYSGIAGSFYDAMDRVKLGMLPGLEGEFLDQYADFHVEFLQKSQSLLLTFPTEAVTFLEEENILSADFELDYFIYTQKGRRVERFRRSAHFEATAEEITRLEKISLSFPMDLVPEDYYFDITLSGPGMTKTRKIFEISVKSRK